MSMTRDQLRAARILLHLRQEQLALAANLSVATLRRFEGGRLINKLRVKALREAVERAGVVLLTGDANESGQTGIGVALLPADRLPAETRRRIAEEDPLTNEVGEHDAPTRPRGRPRKQVAIATGAGSAESTEAGRGEPNRPRGRPKRPTAPSDDAGTAGPPNARGGKRVRKGGNVSS